MVCPRFKPEIPVVVQVEVYYLTRYVVAIQGHLNELEGNGRRRKSVIHQARTLEKIFPSTFVRDGSELLQLG